MGEGSSELLDIITFIVPSEWPENTLSLQQTTDKISPFSLQMTWASSL